MILFVDTEMKGTVLGLLKRNKMHAKSLIFLLLNASLAAFGCMYARKPFSVATFEGMEYFMLIIKLF
jgi:hypothetical protein